MLIRFYHHFKNYLKERREKDTVVVKDGFNHGETVDCERCLSFCWKHCEGDTLSVGYCKFLKAHIVTISVCYIYNPVRKAKKHSNSTRR